MSEPGKHSENAMLERLIRLEEERIAREKAPGLSTAKIDAVKNRLDAERETILARFNNESPLRIAKKSGAAKIWASIGVAAILALGFGLTYFFKTQRTLEVQTAYSKGDFKRTENNFTTGAKSLAILSWGNAASTLMGQNTKLVAKKLEAADRPRIEIENSGGLAFNKVAKDAAIFVMRTPTAVLGVRGTSFSVEVTAEGTVLKVLEGTVEAAARDKGDKAVMVAANQKVAIPRSAGELKVTPLDESEKAYLVKLDKVIGADAATRDNLATELAAAVIPPANSAPKLTLDDIRKKYGKISRVNLKTGASYTGFFVLKGAQMEIVTPRGVVRVPTAQLKDVQDLN